MLASPDLRPRASLAAAGSAILPERHHNTSRETLTLRGPSSNVAKFEVFILREGEAT